MIVSYVRSLCGSHLSPGMASQVIWIASYLMIVVTVNFYRGATLQPVFKIAGGLFIQTGG